MKSTEFIAEDNRQELPDEIITLLDIIKRDCQPYLQQNNRPLRYPLYRGMGKENNLFVEQNIRLENRKPIDMDPVYHNYLNKYFTKNQGAPFRNAMFVTGKRLDAKGYGNLYSIFPIGHFDYIWSEKIKDLFLTIRTEKNQNEVFDLDDLKNLLDWGNYKKSADLEGAITSANEIMIRCKSYYAINEGDTYRYIDKMEEYLNT